MDLVDPDEAARQMLESGFIASLGPKNLRARGAESKEQYEYLYRFGLADWLAVPVGLRRRLAEATLVCKRRLRDAGFRALADMRWRYACGVGRKAENGWPHTTGDVIVLPLSALETRGDEDLIRLLAHEAVHVAQRKDPVGAIDLAERLGFRKADENTARRVAALGEARQNPDTDGALYERLGRICQPVFAGAAVTLNQVRYLPDQSHLGLERIANPEHPHEIVAEIIADAIA